MSKLYQKSLVWLRRDLRLHDNTALYQAHLRSEKVNLCFVFDTEILNALSDKKDQRVDFLHRILLDIKETLKKLQSDIWILHGDPKTEIPSLAKSIQADAVFANRDYEKYGVLRDENIKKSLNLQNISFEDYKDQVLFEANEVLTKTSTPYSVFSPYRNNHLEKLKLTGAGRLNYKVDTINFEKFSANKMPLLAEIGFESTNISNLPIALKQSQIQSQIKDFEGRLNNYDQTRNYPAIKGVSYLSVHNRFGTISIREIADLCLNNLNSGSNTSGSRLRRGNL